MNRVFHEWSLPSEKHVIFTTPFVRSGSGGNSSLFNDAVEWCETNIPEGEWSKDPSWEEIVIPSDLYAMAFKVRWC